jgi:acyl dehydratase/uncharacterized OB-fold protein
MSVDLDLLKTPGPTITALTAPFWQAASEGRLVIQCCQACGKAVFYVRPICPHCWGNRLAWREASGGGRLKSFSVVHKPGHPGWLPAAPYVVGLVELDEGPTMLSFIVAGEDACAVGQSLVLAPTRIGGRLLPAFKPSAMAGSPNQTGDTLMSAETKDGWIGVINGRPQVGAFAERSRRTRLEDIEAFTEMTGDRNPLHYDKALAEASVFGKLIVQGGVTSGILNALVAEDLPGPGTVFLEVSWKFVKAVGIDEMITGRVEVKEVRPDKPICKIETSVRNEAGDICLTGTATVFTVALAKA